MQRQAATRSHLVPALLIAALTAAVYWPALGHEFLNWDDDQNFLNNRHFRGLGWENLRWMFTTFHLGHYHPLTWVSLGMDYEIWGLDSSGYHLTNIILHSLNGVLLYFVGLRLLGGRTWVALAAALLFSLHPMRVESVAWVSERRDVLSGLFYLASALAYLRAQQRGPRGRWLATSLAAFAAALLSKVIVVSLPAVLLVLDFWPLKRFPRERWRLLMEKIPYAAMAAAAAIAALAMQRTGVSGFAEHVAVLPELRVGLSLYGLAFYLWKTVVPIGLYSQYVMAAELGSWDGRIVAGALVAAVVTAAAVLLRRRWPAVLAVWVCYAVSLLPVLSIARVDPQQYVADHHSYLATMGVSLATAAALALLPARHFQVTATVLALALGLLARRQVGFWRDSVSLWTHTLAGSPNSVVAHNNLGETLAAAGRLEEAIEHFERAIAIKPRHAHAHYNLGQARQKQGKLEAAATHFLEAVAIEPSFAAARNDLANCYSRLGRPEEAERHYREALRHRPQFADAHYNLGNLLQQKRQFEEAMEHYEQALREKPAYADAHNNWGVALDALGRAAEAQLHYRQALVLDPQNADAHNNLGVSLEAAGKREQALSHYREALRWNPAHAEAAANLARIQGTQ